MTAQEANISVWEPGTRRMGEDGPGADRTALGVARKRVWLFMTAVVAGRRCQAGAGRTGLVGRRLCAGCG